MAKFELTAEEFTRWTHSDLPLSRRGAVKWAGGAALLIVAAVLGQWAFAASWGAALLLMAFVAYVMMPREARARFLNNPFNLGPVEVEFNTHSYTVRVGGSELRLHVNELAIVHDFVDHYTLIHKCGAPLRVPKRSLTDVETELIEAYRRRFPGLPENKARPVF